MAQICTKSFVGWGLAPDPTGGAYSAPPDLLAGLRGLLLRGGEGRGREGGEGPRSAPQVNFLDPPMHRRADCKLQRFGHVNAKNAVHINWKVA